MAAFGIKVIVIEPGAIRTEWSAIAADHLDAVSASTAYRDQAALVSGMLRAGYSRTASEPSAVATPPAPSSAPAPGLGTP